MKIAYLAAYQSEKQKTKRRIKRNIALAGSQKIKLIAKTLSSLENSVYIISESFTVEYSKKYYPLSVEKIDKKVIAISAGCIDYKYLSVILAVVQTLFVFIRIHIKKKFDLVIIYNVGLNQFLYFFFAKIVFNIPVIIEYEDDATVSRSGHKTFLSNINSLIINIEKKFISGSFVVSKKVGKSFLPDHQILLRGIIDLTLEEKIKNYQCVKKNILLYTGSLSESKGIKNLLIAWNKIDMKQDWQLHVTGDGPLAELAQKHAEENADVFYHGVISREDLAELQVKSKICVNPHLMSNVIGNVFPFKIIEYLATGAVVISTPLLDIEEDLESGIIFTKDDSIDSILYVIEKSINNYVASDKKVMKYVLSNYSMKSISNKIKVLFERIENEK